MFKTVLDSREVAFLIRQMDKYIEAMEFMSRKTPALDKEELALARNLRTELSAGIQAETLIGLPLDFFVLSPLQP